VKALKTNPRQDSKSTKHLKTVVEKRRTFFEENLNDGGFSEGHYRPHPTPNENRREIIELRGGFRF
jgi:hypothetical protein